MEELWGSIEWIHGVKTCQGEEEDILLELDDEEEGGEESNESGWTVIDLYRGLVPRRLVEGWQKLFSTTRLIATLAATKFVSQIEEIGRTEVWGKRCEDTIAWEKTVGITARDKRPLERRGVRPEERRRTGDFSDLRQHRRPTVAREDINSEADRRVLLHYQGKRKLDVMEGLRGLQTQLLMLDLD